MEYTFKPEKIAIYVGRCAKSLSQVKTETGADVAINGGLYNADLTACCHLKVDGQVIAKDPWKYFGYAWNDKDIACVSDYSNYKNYICCVCLVQAGNRQLLLYPNEMGGARPRTAMGLFPDGRVWVYASSSPKTPEQLQDYALNLGLDSAIMLDGGNSTQGYCPTGSVVSSRKVHNYILMWTREPCPYTEPTVYLSRGSKGEGVKWLQWMLNKHGASLEVDGLFGGKTHAATVVFQTNHPPLTPDGIVGLYTRRKLKEYGADGEILKPDYKWNGTLVTRSKPTQYIILHHAAADGSPENVHEYHKSKGWTGIGYNMYVRKNGQIYEGRPLDKIGAHCVGYNDRSVGICFEGNFEVERMSQTQIDAGRKALAHVRALYPNAKVVQHKDLAATACAGKFFPMEDIVNE